MEEQDIPVPAKTRGLLLERNINPESKAEKISQILIIFIKPYKPFLHINNKHTHTFYIYIYINKKFFYPPLSPVAVEIGS